MALAFTSKKRLKLQPLIDFGGRYIYHDSHEKTDYNSICSDHMDGTMRQFLFKMATIAGAFSIASIPLAPEQQQQPKHEFHLPNQNPMRNSSATL